MAAPGSIPIPDPTELTSRAVNEAKTELTTLFDEKLRAISRRLDDAERHRVEQKADTTKALDAAFAAAKEAVTGVDVRVNDLKDRVTRMESSRAGFYAAIGLIVSLLAVVGFVLVNSNTP